MIRNKVLSLSLMSVIILVVFFIANTAKAPLACASDQGNCLTIGGDQNDVCYTGAKGSDYAPGYACGDKNGYVYDNSKAVPKQTLQCASKPQGSIDGACCKPGTPLPTLPPHGSYQLGGDCNTNSICYTGDYPQPPLAGEACGTDPVTKNTWHFGTDGRGGVAFCELGGHICCDAGAGQTTPIPPNPCPDAPTPGVCQSINTALGPIDVTNAGAFIKTIFALLLSLSGGIALILIIISGYRIMMAQGDPEKVKGAREMLTSAIIGLLFMIFSVSILQILGVDILHIPGFK